jgi:di/tricarboxylate transporter
MVGAAAASGNGGRKKANVRLVPGYSVARLMRLSHAIAVLSLVAALVVLLLPAPAGLAPAAQRAAALTIAAIGLWASGALPEHVTALAFFLAANLLAVAPQSVIFSGFASGALWLVFSGFIIAHGMRRSGLAERLAHAMARLFPPSYGGQVTGVVAVGLLLSFVMPSSMGRVALFVPIVVALTERLGLKEGSVGRAGILHAACLGVILPGFAILPSNVPNLVMIGAAEQVHGITPSYAAWLALHLPVIGILKAVFLVVLVLVLFRAPAPPAPRWQAPPPPRRDERRLAWLLGLTLLLWVSDTWHGISPAWIGMAAALACLLPGLRLVPMEEVGRGNQLAPMLHVAAIMGLGGVVAASGLAETLGALLVGATGLEPGADGRNFAALVGGQSVLGLATLLTGMPAVVTPLAADLATAAGLPLMTVLMTQVVAFSTVILPYQLAPLIVALRLAGLATAEAAKLTLSLAAVSFAVLAPLDYLWFRALGYLG